MLVQFLVNLGTVDATRLDLEYAKCKAGATLDVSPKTGEHLVRREWAIDVTPQPVKVEEPIVEPTPVPAPVPVKESKKQKNDSTPNK